MAAEFEAEAKNSLRSLQASVEALAKSQGRLNDEVRKYGQHARQGFGHGDDEAKKATKTARELEKAWREGAHALDKLGGPLGELIGRLGGSAGMAGGFAKVAAIATVAGVALEAFHAVVDRNVERATAAGEAYRKMSDALESVYDVTKKQADAGVGQAPDQRRLRAVGGQEAIDQVDRIAGEGVIERGEAAKAVEALYGRYGAGERARSAVSTTEALAKTGVPATEAASQLIEIGGNLAAPGAARRAAGVVFNRHYGRMEAGSEGFNAALAATGDDPFLAAAARASGQRSEIALTERKRGTEQGETSAREDKSAAESPETAAILKLHAAHEREMAVQEQILKHMQESADRAPVWGLYLLGEWAAWKQEQKILGMQSAYGAGVQAAPFGPGG